MALNYQKVWETMNSLETVVCKATSVRQVIDAAVDALEEENYDKAESLMSAAYDFIGYFIDDFDENFKNAWDETVVKLKEEESSWKSWEEFYYPEDYKKNSEDNDCMPPWGHSDMEALSQQKEDKVIKWSLPVEMDTVSEEYFIHLPEDLLERTGWKEDDNLNWVDNGDGTFTICKINKPLGMDDC